MKIFNLNDIKINIYKLNLLQKNIKLWIKDANFAKTDTIQS